MNLSGTLNLVEKNTLKEKKYRYSQSLSLDNEIFNGEYFPVL